MTTRRYTVLLAALAAALGLGYAGYRWWVGAGHRAGTDQPAVAQSQADPPPPEPEPDLPDPGRPKTKGELLVGTWKRVKRSKPGLERMTLIYQYRADGTFTYWSDNPLEPPELRIQGCHGTYRLVGDLVVRECSPDFVLTSLIEDITEERLVMSGMSGETRIIDEWVRLRRK